MQIYTKCKEMLMWLIISWHEETVLSIWKCISSGIFCEKATKWTTKDCTLVCQSEKLVDRSQAQLYKGFLNLIMKKKNLPKLLWMKCLQHQLPPRGVKLWDNCCKIMNLGSKTNKVRLVGGNQGSFDKSFPDWTSHLTPHCSRYLVWEVF